MAEETKYQVGILCHSGNAKFLWQSSNITLESDEYEAKNDKGNVKCLTQINHRIKLSLEAIFPLGTDIPKIGDKVKLCNVSLPSYDEGSNKLTGNFKINEATGDSATPASEEFLVTGTVSVTQSNTDYMKCSFEVTRWLCVGVPENSEQ